MNLSDITMKRLEEGGWVEERNIDIIDIESIFKERKIELFQVTKDFLAKFGMVNIEFPKPGSLFNTVEKINFNPFTAIGDCLDGEYFNDLEEEYKDIIGEKVNPVGETDRGNLILLITPTEKYYGYTDGCLVKYGDDTEEMLECLCIPKVPKIF